MFRPLVTAGLLITLIFTCVDLAASADLPKTSEFLVSFGFPGQDEVVGPALVICESSTECVSFPSVLESAEATGRLLKLNELAEAKRGDFVWGTAADVGLVETPELRGELRNIYLQAISDYEEWANRAPQLADVQGPPQVADLPKTTRKQMIDYARTDKGKVCSIAVKALRAGKASSIELQLATHTIYRRLCFDSIDNPETFVGRLVFFFDGDGQVPSCVGLVLTRNLVLTARHCFAPGHESWEAIFTRDRVMLPALAVGAVPGRFAIVFGDPNKYSVSIPDGDFNTPLTFHPVSDADSDYVFVTLDKYSGQIPAIDISTPKPGDELLIPSLTTLDFNLLGHPKSFQNQIQKSALAIDSSPLCAVVAILQRKCLVHSCQTEGGYSGTPILLRDHKGSLSILGVHTGRVDKSGKIPAPCDFKRGPYFSNYGVVVPHSRLKDAQAN